jgi:hypothetical protein
MSDTDSYISFTFLDDYYQKTTEELVALATAACPGLEHGRIYVPVPVAYARWRNGPDFYEFVQRISVYDSTTHRRLDPADVAKLDDSHRDVRDAVRGALVRAIHVWGKIAKKAKTSPPREPLDARAYVEQLTGEEWRSLWHAIEGQWDGWHPDMDKRYHAMITAQPEHWEDLLRFEERRHVTPVTSTGVASAWTLGEGANIYATSTVAS